MSQRIRELEEIGVEQDEMHLAAELLKKKKYNADAFEARGADEVKQEAAHEEAPKVRGDKAR